eukprot:5378715-Prymnesium_polylepis.1
MPSSARGKSACKVQTTWTPTVRPSYPGSTCGRARRRGRDAARGPRAGRGTPQSSCSCPTRA